MPIRRAFSLRPVNSLKHEITWSNLGQDASGGINVEIVEGVENPVSPDEVDTASIVKSIYFEFNLNGVDNSGTVQVFHWQIIKVNGGMAFSIASFYNTDQKKYIIKRGMEMLPQIPIGSGGTVQTKRIFVVKLPPRMRRFDDGDKLILNYVSTSASNINFCGIAIYKEFK